MKPLRSQEVRRAIPPALGALGVVYGDIGTSPLYSLRECFHGLHAIAPTHGNVLGVLSLLFWSLTAVISFKYLVFVLRADNRGEGGIFALLALLPAAGRKLPGATLIALTGAALLYGDGIITPAISVLSAIEGLDGATHAAERLIVPLTCVVLIGLFSIQSRGTGRIGRAFGPVMLVWFGALAVLGVGGIAHNPRVLLALNPAWALSFFLHNGARGALVLGSVVLALTGAEALYADLGHFGRSPIRLSWFGLVFPALLLNYFGQGALLLESPGLVSNPFYGLVPRPLLYPMVGLATVAAVIASQALISGVFSLTRQAIQLGYLPRVRVIHTSGAVEGQIYVPLTNRVVMVLCVALVLGFRSSDRLAAAYGIAVTANMVITSLLFFLVARKTWGWRRSKAISLVTVFLIFDLLFFGSSLLKFVDGGWIPLAVASLLVMVMLTWRDGRASLARQMTERSIPLRLFVDDVGRRPPIRVPGTAVFLTSSVAGCPTALLHHFKHNHVLHEKVAVLFIASTETPTVPTSKRVEVTGLGHGFFRVTAAYGFMESPNVPEIMRLAAKGGLKSDPAETSFFLGRETLITSGSGKMASWRKVLFSFLSRNAQSATMWFGLPPGRVIELGVQIEL